MTTTEQRQDMVDWSLADFVSEICKRVDLYPDLAARMAVVARRIPHENRVMDLDFNMHMVLAAFRVPVAEQRKALEHAVEQQYTAGQFTRYLSSHYSTWPFTEDQ
jgi:hypothetical protein